MTFHDIPWHSMTFHDILPLQDTAIFLSQHSRLPGWSTQAHLGTLCEQNLMALDCHDLVAICLGIRWSWWSWAIHVIHWHQSLLMVRSVHSIENTKPGLRHAEKAVTVSTKALVQRTDYFDYLNTFRFDELLCISVWVQLLPHHNTSAWHKDIQRPRVRCSGQRGTRRVHGALFVLVLWWRHTHLSGANHSCQVRHGPQPTLAHPTIPLRWNQLKPVETGATKILTNYLQLMCVHCQTIFRYFSHILRASRDQEYGSSYCCVHVLRDDTRESTRLLSQSSHSSPVFWGIKPPVLLGMFCAPIPQPRTACNLRHEAT